MPVISAIVRLLPRRQGTTDTSDTANADLVEADAARGVKGRPTPKRRESAPRRGPVAPAPRTRKEAMAWQRQQAQAAKTSKTTSATALTAQERRARMMAGDPAYLARRDAGPVKALARDWVDSHRMLSNYLLLLLPLLVLSARFRAANIVVIALFAVVIVEWYITGRRLLGMAKARGLDVGRQSAFGVGFYAGSRAYMLRRWRVPKPRVSMGDKI